MRAKNTSKSVDFKTFANHGSPLGKYQQTMVGSTGILALIVYELFEMFVTPVPGNIGLLLRRCLYPYFFASCAGNLKSGKNISAARPNSIYIGENVSIGERVSLSVKKSGGVIRLDDDSLLGAETVISCNGGEVRIGAGSQVQKHCRLGSMLGLQIGKNCHIGSFTYIIGGAHAFDRVDIPIIDQPLACRGETIIADNVHIGERVTIRDGLRIGNGACVENDSLVLHDVPAGKRVSGVYTDRTA